ncbi:MAG: recombinase family protein [Candidatus Nealsonbacteria bacterium]|nr:recombinase family protein [Candidatus Nealsonbacteria bacterium]
MNNNNFFLYARKSTDVEDKQVRSIEDQIAELRAFAKQENLNIIDVFIEKQSAKIPGRPIFNEMIEKIERGEANGILAWHADRLARNSVDGGRIIYLLDTGKLASLKFPTLWFENTPQGKFMLNIVFGQSKYYIDSLAENTKRGLRQKVKRGEYPSLAPIGYINDKRIKSVVVDKKRAPIIRKAFELYAQNNSRLEDISNFLEQQGITSRGNKNLKRDRISFILSNPFYVGLFRYAGEIHEGKHQPVISKKIFDRVQEILKQRGRPHHKTKNEPQAFCGLLRCGICGMGITGEYKVKRQKNGNEHYYVYYHCTRKNKLVKCKEPCIRQEKLDQQISSLLQKFSLREDWAEGLLQKLENEKMGTAQSSAAFVRESKNKIGEIQIKLQRLLDGYLEQDIDREIYREEKAKLLSDKKSLEEQTTNLEQKRTGWIEPMEEWIKGARNLPKIAREGNLFGKKVAAKEIFGSNLVLANREARLAAPSRRRAERICRGEMLGRCFAPPLKWTANLQKV